MSRYLVASKCSAGTLTGLMLPVVLTSAAGPLLRLLVEEAEREDKAL